MPKAGKFEISTLKTGTFGLDGGAMFGIVPKPLWNKTYPSDDANRITLGTRCLLFNSPKRKILVDTGIGNGWDEKFNKIYNVRQDEFTIFNSLKEKGLTPSDITDIILTHLHFDHTGGSVIFENGKAVPAFPNAVYHVQKKHLEWAKNPNERDGGSFIKNRFFPLLEEGMLNVIDGEGKFDEGIEILNFHGHTPFQQLIKIISENEIYFFCGDLIPTSAHIPVPYVMGYDLFPVETVKEKTRILKMAAEENWKLVFEHDAYTEAAEISIGEKGFSAKQKFTEAF